MILTDKLKEVITMDLKSDYEDSSALWTVFKAYELITDTISKKFKEVGEEIIPCDIRKGLLAIEIMTDETLEILRPGFTEEEYNQFLGRHYRVLDQPNYIIKVWDESGILTYFEDNCVYDMVITPFVSETNVKEMLTEMLTNAKSVLSELEEKPS